ncbi:hypothetical protein NITHO_1020024 [Nitrolancea hollandica Lb]|uniref:Uncharacterized protein n=1 Tax=Nitrolancea hollandica Lb TaxID=1129897 RepID=I4ECD2_9BACT|nr:hypothetical protein NITHO_1020024 [Nitrolancea hollandica Lb]
MVEQVFRKHQVIGSSPMVGSKPKWRNRQTRYVQGVVGIRPWEFKSPLRHHRPEACLVQAFALTDRVISDRMVAGQEARGKSELHRARVPGESRGNAGRWR